MFDSTNHRSATLWYTYCSAQTSIKTYIFNNNNLCCRTITKYIISLCTLESLCTVEPDLSPLLRQISLTGGTVSVFPLAAQCYSGISCCSSTFCHRFSDYTEHEPSPTPVPSARTSAAQTKG